MREECLISGSETHLIGVATQAVWRLERVLVWMTKYRLVEQSNNSTNSTFGAISAHLMKMWKMTLCFKYSEQRPRTLRSSKIHFKQRAIFSSVRCNSMRSNNASAPISHLYLTQVAMRRKHRRSSLTSQSPLPIAMNQATMLSSSHTTIMWSMKQS